MDGNTVKGNRLMSLDALRGFDMFWIMGGEGLLCTLAALFGFPEFHKSFGHVPWDGLQFMDTVFPTFLFMAGASFPFSCAKSRERGMTNGQIARRALRRGVTLMLLGLVYGGFLRHLDFANFRIPSVLGYIGFGWMVAAWIYLGVKSVKARIGIAVGILAAVTLFLGLVTAPDVTEAAAALQKAGANNGWWAQFASLGTGPFTPAGNFGCYLDRTLLGHHALTPYFDNEGFGGLLCTIVTAMLGMFAGEIVRAGGVQATGRKALKLLVSAVVCLVVGLGLSLYYPVIKNLWSPSFVLVVGSYSFAMFALFYWIIDVKGFRKWSFFFMVIGMNSITIYMAQAAIGFQNVTNFCVGGLAKMCPKTVGELVINLGYIAACWLFLLFLYRKKVFLKV